MLSIEDDAIVVASMAISSEPVGPPDAAGGRQAIRAVVCRRDGAAHGSSLRRTKGQLAIQDGALLVKQVVLHARCPERGIQPVAS